MKRVVVTGIAGFSPLGNDWENILSRLQSGHTGIVAMPEWDKYEGLNTRLGARVENFTIPKHYSRKDLRSMGRVAQLAVVSTENALIDAGLLGHDILQSGMTGVAYGSSAGDTDAIADFGNMLLHDDCDGLNANLASKYWCLFRSQRPCLYHVKCLHLSKYGNRSSLRGH